MICPENTPVNPAPMLGRYAPDFELPGIDGNVHHLARYLEHHRAIAIVFLSGTCPQVAQTLPHLLGLQADLYDQGFTCIGISTNDAAQVPADNLDRMAIFAQQQGLTFPYIRDVTQDVAQAFGVSCTPEAFLLDADSRVRYQGSIQVEGEPALAEATLALLADQALPVEATAPQGTPICWR